LSSSNEAINKYVYRILQKEIFVSVITTLNLFT